MLSKTRTFFLKIVLFVKDPKIEIVGSFFLNFGKIKIFAKNSNFDQKSIVLKFNIMFKIKDIFSFPVISIISILNICWNLKNS